MNSSILNKVTLMIPTFNRALYLFRILDYYSLHAPDLKILLGDSSSDENKETNKKIISTFQSLDIMYLGDYSSDIHTSSKVCGMSKHVNTPFCVICADDDFITPEGIAQSAEFLEKNQDYTVAHGHYAAFWTKLSGTSFCWEPCYAYESNTSPDPVVRFLSHFSNYDAATFYAVHNTEFLKMIFDEGLKFSDTTVMGELLLTLLTLICGKMEHLDVFYMARTKPPVPPKHQYLNDILREGSFDQRYAKFRRCLSLHLSRQAQLDIDEAGRIVDQGMYLHYTIKNVIKKEDRKSLTLYDKLFLPGEKIMSNFAEALDVSSSKYYKDFSNIRNHVLKHSKEQTLQFA
jgi:glycosyltransferase domain-containing protein